MAYFYTFSASSSLFLTLASLFLLFISYLIARKQFMKTIWFGLISHFCMICIGILTVSLHDQSLFKNHYTKILNTDSVPTTTFRIREILKPNTYYNKYIVDILEIDDSIASGKTLLNISKDSTNTELHIDDVYISKGYFQSISAPLNPGQFDYKAYLKKKYIYHQITSNYNELFKIKSNTKTLLGLADGLRKHINNKLKVYHFKPDELAIINALLLGQRQDISEDIYSSYVNAGVIHILAVSGLHVGIILMFLNFILKPMESIKHGKTCKIILLVLLLWSFAVIAGLSASVTRAVTMFSVLAIAMNLKRPTNIYNTLALSMLAILLVKPLFLFDVGFQLSYLAVFSIVTIDPILYKLWIPKNKILNFYWHTLTVTISAQLGIFPISLYYFHQFSGLFFISNLVIIPPLGFILGFGILILIQALLNIPSNVLNSCFGYIITSMNTFISWVAQQSQFIYETIAFSLSQTLAAYILIIASVLLFKKRNYTSFKLLLSGIIVIQLAFIFISYNKPHQEFIIFHKSRHTLIGNTINHQLTFATDVDSMPLFQNIVNNYQISKHIETTKRDSLKPIYLLDTKTILIIDSLGIYNIKSVQPDYVLLRQSPQLNLNRLIDSIKPKTIIADGSNYKSYIEQWGNVCSKRKLPFHYTGEKGAYSIRY
ncbi:ComEC/Rec2 family competence protein [Aestuariibaculum suncheonense]|nr:ComEC/Rec2 family competence protein [Aestuariibaculum suncheonense]